MKVARLGRQSFKTVKNNRDYLQGRTQYNWLYLSRLATTREYDYMKALHAKGFPVPEPIDSNRHVICMSLLPAHTICKVGSIADPEKVYNQAMDLLVKFAEQGLIHGDFNEFNLLLSSSLTLYCIDFPQMVSRSHPEAEYFFKRDFECIQTLFKRKYRLEGERKYELKDVDRVGEIDREVKASGWDIEGGKDKGGIEEYYRRKRIEGGKEGGEGEDGESEGEGEDGEEDGMEEEGESEWEYEGDMMDEGDEEFDEEEYEQDELLEQSDDEKKVEEKLPETPLEKEPQEEEESEEEESEDLEAAQERRRRGKELKRQAKQAQMEARQKAVQKFKEEIAAKKEAEAKAKEARGDEEEDDSEDSLSDNETKERIKKSLKKKFKQKKPNRAKHNHPKKANALAKQM